MRRASALALLLALAGPARATEEPLTPVELAHKRGRERERVLAERSADTGAVARHQAWLAYRLARKRDIGFVGDPQGRVGAAQAFDLTLAALRRSVDEDRLAKAELGRVRDGRQALERATTVAAAEPAHEGPAPRFVRPVTGAVVGEPGLRKDPATGTELRYEQVELLARWNEPVKAVAAGTVKRIEALPQGGFAVVIEHAGGWSSVLSGLRSATVGVGARVEAGGAVGAAGRNLDGAAVVALELWRGRRPVDPRLALAPHAVAQDAPTSAAQ